MVATPSGGRGGVVITPSPSYASIIPIGTRCCSSDGRPRCLVAAALSVPALHLEAYG